MRRILIFSDTHGKTADMFDIIDKIPNVDGVIHLGDIYRDVICLHDKYEMLPVYFVLGNNDLSLPYPDKREIIIDDVPIFITHGHSYSVNTGTEVLLKAPESKKAKVILYGHTHIAYYKKVNGRIIANPGSLTKPLLGMPSYGVLEIENGKIGYSNIEIL